MKIKVQEQRSGMSVTVEKEVEQCKSTTVQAISNIPVGSFEHAGVITHRCQTEQGHEGVCKCGCGHTWIRFKDVK